MASKSRHLKRLAMSVIATTLVALATASAAIALTVTTTVPNQYLCSRWTGKCVQVNGRHVNGLPNACYWSWNLYFSGSSTAVCTYWP